MGEGIKEELEKNPEIVKYKDSSTFLKLSMLGKNQTGTLK